MELPNKSVQTITMETTDTYDPILQSDMNNQDDYTIPDEELGSDASSLASYIEGEDAINLGDESCIRSQQDEQIDMAQANALSSNKQALESSQWTTFTTRKQQAAGKKLKTSAFTPEGESVANNDWSVLKQASMEDITAARAQNEVVTSYKPSQRGQVLLTTLDNVEDKATNAKYAHELRRGGITEAELCRIQSNKTQTVNTSPTPSGTSQKAHTTLDTQNSSLPTKPFSLVLPNDTKSPENRSVTFYTYRAQLTFSLPKSMEGVNVAKYFRRWVFSASESIANFSVLPYDDEKGLQITNLDQVPEDNKDFYSTYYHNHRILNHGNLTGMVAFQSSTPWAQLKSPNHPFFSWLRLNKVFINQTKFKTSTLVPVGFLLGAHPGYLRRDEAEAELKVSLGFQDEELPFQLSARSVSVAVQDGKSDRYAFQAVVVETSTQQAASLREKFFSLGNPKQALNKFPYTGKYQFVPFLKTKEWTVSKILSLAKVHVTIIQDLKTIFLANLKNIHNIISQDGTTLMQGFYGMVNTSGNNETTPIVEPLLHSIHNTSKDTTKVALVPSSHYDEALTQLSAIHSILASYIPPAYQQAVFVDSLQASIIGQQIDSVSSCNSAAYATEILNRYNPQDGEELADPKPIKRFRQVPLTYAAATTKDTVSDLPTEPLGTTIPSVSPSDLDHLFEKMKEYVAENSSSKGITIEELELRMSKSTKEVQTARDQLSETVSNIAARVDTLSEEIKHQNSKISDEIGRQNVIILGMQQQFQESMADFSSKLQELYNKSNNTTPSITTTASTSKTSQWGERGK